MGGFGSSRQHIAKALEENRSEQLYYGGKGSTGYESENEMWEELVSLTVAGETRM